MNKNNDVMSLQHVEATLAYSEKTREQNCADGNHVYIGQSYSFIHTDFKCYYCEGHIRVTNKLTGWK